MRLADGDGHVSLADGYRVLLELEQLPPTPSMISLFVASHSVVATAHVLNPPGQQAVLESVAEYEAAKKSFTDLLVECSQNL